MYHCEQLLHISLCITLGCSGCCHDSMPIKNSFSWTCGVYLLQQKHYSQTSLRSLRMHCIAMYACSCMHIPLLQEHLSVLEICSTNQYLREGLRAASRSHVLKGVAHLHASAWQSSANAEDVGKADRQHTLCNWCFELEQHPQHVFFCIQCATCLHWSMHYLMPELASSRTMLCHAICSHSEGRLHIVTAQSVPPIHIFVFMATCTMTPPINARALRKACRTIGSDMYNTTIIDLKLTCCVLILMSGSQICQSSSLA